MFLRFDDAADAIRRELGLHQQNESYQAAGRLTVALVLVQLARGDVVAAEKAFKEWGKLKFKILNIYIVFIYSKYLLNIPH